MVATGDCVVFYSKVALTDYWGWAIKLTYHPQVHWVQPSRQGDKIVLTMNQPLCSVHQVCDVLWMRVLVKIITNGQNVQQIFQLLKPFQCFMVRIDKEVIVFNVGLLRFYCLNISLAFLLWNNPIQCMSMERSTTVCNGYHLSIAAFWF